MKLLLRAAIKYVKNPSRSVLFFAQVLYNFGRKLLSAFGDMHSRVNGRK